MVHVDNRGSMDPDKTPGIQFILEPGGKIIVNVIEKMVGQEIINYLALVSRVEAFAFQLYIFPVKQGRNNTGIG